MARKSKRNRKPQLPRLYLRRGDRIKVVACLDYALEHDLDLTSVAVNNLDLLKGRERKVAERAIHGALREEYRNYGRSEGDISFQTFLTEGSTFLRYDRGDPETLRDERRRVIESGGQYPPRETLRTTTTRSRALAPHPPAGSDTSGLSLHSTPEFEGFNGSMAWNDDRSGENRPSPAAAVPRQLLRSAAVSPASMGEESFPQSTRAEEVPETVSPQTPIHATHEVHVDALEKELARRAEELKAASRTIVQQQDHIFTLSNRLTAAEKECKEIERSIKKAAELKDNVTVQANLRYENSVLRDQNIKMISQREVISKAARDSLVPTNQSVREEFDLILAGLKDGCSSVSITMPRVARAFDADDLNETPVLAWSRRLTGLTFREFVAGAIDDNISDIHIISALTATATADLVFESSFPDFLPRESPMLDQYRQHILTRAGPKVLSELDLLACHSILSTPNDQDNSNSYFHSKILVKTASDLSLSLANALQGVLSPSDDTMLGADLEPDPFCPQTPATPTQEDRNQTEPRSLVAMAFEEHILRALKLKANLLLARSKYKLVFPHPGHRFDATTMVRDGESQRTGSRFAQLNGKRNGEQELQGRLKVKLCLFPGLYVRREEVLSGKEYGVGVNVRNCLVECDNFVKGGGEEGRGMEGFSLVVRAVVLV